MALLTLTEVPLLCEQKKLTLTLFTASNSYALAAPNAKELQSWTSKLDPTRLPA